MSRHRSSICWRSRPRSVPRPVGHHPGSANRTPYRSRSERFKVVTTLTTCAASAKTSWRTHLPGRLLSQQGATPEGTARRSGAKIWRRAPRYGRGVVRTTGRRPQNGKSRGGAGLWQACHLRRRACSPDHQSSGTGSDQDPARYRNGATADSSDPLLDHLELVSGRLRANTLHPA